MFAIEYGDFQRMLSVWEAWLEFLEFTMGGPLFYSREAIARERMRRPALTRGNEPDLFVKFAIDVGGLTNRQAEAMFWK